MNHDFETDILIVGGGPAGASTALSVLIYSDLKVIIVENSALGNIRVGEQVNPSLFDLLSYLKIGKNKFKEGSLIKGYSSMAAWGSDSITSRDSIFSTQEASYQIDREQFDMLLLSEAAERGAIILPRTKCTNFRPAENNYWEACLKHKTQGDILVKAKFLVDATGRQSSVCRQIGVDTLVNDQLIAVGAFLHFNEKKSIKQEILIETVEEGWWYCATLPNQKVTTTLFTDADIAKEKQLQKPENWNNLLSETRHIKTRVKHSSTTEGLWVKNAFSKITKPGCRNNFISVGDATASFDPISSMGIGFAISSGCHAANAIIASHQGNPASMDHYQKNIDTIYDNYLSVKSQFYGKEKRWSNSVFWKRRL